MEDKITYVNQTIPECSEFRVNRVNHDLENKAAQGNTEGRGLKEQEKNKSPSHRHEIASSGRNLKESVWLEHSR